MNFRAIRRRTGWLPAAAALLLVLGVGARLIALGVQQRAEAARESAARQAAEAVRGIETQLQALADAARREAGRAGGAVTAAAPQSFSIGPDSAVAAAARSSPQIVAGIAAEWANLPASRADATGKILGPSRQGSQWIIAALAPTATNGAPGSTSWWGVYADWDRLLSTIRRGRLTDADYDVEIAQGEANGGPERIISGSAESPLQEPISRRVRWPSGFSPVVRDSQLRVGVRPRAGWYPAGEIVAQTALLMVVAWIIAFGVQDLVHTLRRLRSAISHYRRRLGSMRARLTAEIEKREELQKSVAHARYHDGFTGLPNRRYFSDQLDRALRELRIRRRHRIGIILIDIARFKLINDILGHTAGDELMVQIARRFSGAIASLDCVLARWGGDQFAVLLLDVASADAAMVFAEVLQDALRAPFDLRRRRLSIAATMGVTTFTALGPQRVEDAVQEADIALTAAKRSNTVKKALYVPSMGGDAASLVSLEADLHVALANNQLRLLFQPIVDLRTHRMVGAEALLRWEHPLEGTLTPDKFLMIAEEAGLMVPITQRIIARVCRLAAVWRDVLPPGQAFYLSVNLSASVLRDPEFSGFVAKSLQEAGIPAAQLKLEATESALIGDVGDAREALARLRQLGVQLMLDDFGTGFSSLNYLQLFPLDFVKIDRPFASRDAADLPNRSMVSALLQMTPSLGLTAIAEIVESRAAAEALLEMGCQYGQGNFFCEPVRAEAALQYLRGEPLPIRDADADRTLIVADDSPTMLLPVAHSAD